MVESKRHSGGTESTIKLRSLIERGEQMLTAPSMHESTHQAWAQSVKARLKEAFPHGGYALPWPGVSMDEDADGYLRDALSGQLRYLKEILDHEKPSVEAVHHASQPDLLEVFQSHSSADQALAEACVNLLRAAIDIPPKLIRCTSVDGYKLEGGTDYETQLRTETQRSTVFVALITPNSLASTFTFFELGARWGAERKMFPIVARGITAAGVDRPLSSLTLINGTSRSEMMDFVSSVATELGRTPNQPSVWMRNLEAFLDLARERVSESLADNPSNASSLQPVITRPTISADAFELLVDASHGSGMIRRVTDGMRLKIGAHQKSIDANTGKERAHWEAVLQELLSSGFVDRTSASVFRMTKAGYDAVAPIQKQQAPKTDEASGS